MMTFEDSRSALGGLHPQWRIASVSKYIPYPSVTHAGGQYVGQHLGALADFAAIELFAPDTPLNRAAMPQFDVSASSELMRGVGPGATGRFKTLFDVESAWAGSAVAWPYRRLFQTDRAPWSALGASGLIEFHWSEMIALAPDVRRRLPDAVLVGIAHDVITQRWERAADAAANPLVRGAYSLAARRSRVQESRSFRDLDVLLVFSEKDAALASALAPETRVEVVHPGLGPTMPVKRDVDAASPVVLFTGALNRPDNERGILWFLDRIWPFISTDFPSARLVIAGANAQTGLIRAVSRAPRASLTGFVESLDPWYAQAAVFVAPLLTGAGVKFKTIDAMLRGVPVVSTTVGAEGIDASGLFASVTDDPREFAAAVVTELREPDRGRAAAAQRWADGVYGERAFRDRLRTLYGELLSGR